MPKFVQWKTEDSCAIVENLYECRCKCWYKLLLSHLILKNNTSFRLSSDVLYQNIWHWQRTIFYFLAFLEHFCIRMVKKNTENIKRIFKMQFNVLDMAKHLKSTWRKSLIKNTENKKRICKIQFHLLDIILNKQCWSLYRGLKTVMRRISELKYLNK